MSGGGSVLGQMLREKREALGYSVARGFTEDEAVAFAKKLKRAGVAPSGGDAEPK